MSVNRHCRTRRVPSRGPARLAAVRLAIAALAALAGAPAAGQDSGISPEVERRIERGDFFNACRPMRLLVEGLRRGAATDAGLSRETLRAAAGKPAAGGEALHGRQGEVGRGVPGCDRQRGRADVRSLGQVPQAGDRRIRATPNPPGNRSHLTPSAHTGPQFSSCRISRRSWTTSWPRTCASTRRPATTRHLCPSVVSRKFY